MIEISPAQQRHQLGRAKAPLRSAFARRGRYATNKTGLS